jgi:hypothetical protein
LNVPLGVWLRDRISGVIVKRRSRGFEQVGRVGLEGCGLRRAEARRLRLEHGWKVVAGEAVAGRLRVARVARGTLEISADARWATSLEPVLGGLVGRLAGRFPELGIRRYRLTVEGAPEAKSTVTVSPESADTPDAERPATPVRPSREDAGPPTPLQERIERAARRYLERAERSSR